ncbi:MAG: hypothetical protein ABIZ56_04500 [Chthoniobacteraceae bacterium]
MMAHFAAIASAAGAAAFVLIAAWGVGGCFQKWLRECSGLLDSECAEDALLAGTGLLGLVTFLIGLLHFSVWSSVAVLLAGALLNFLFQWPGRRWMAVSPSLIFVAVVVLLCLISGIARPIGHTDADELAAWSMREKMCTFFSYEGAVWDAESWTSGILFASIHHRAIDLRLRLHRHARLQRSCDRGGRGGCRVETVVCPRTYHRR